MKIKNTTFNLPRHMLKQLLFICICFGCGYSPYSDPALINNPKINCSVQIIDTGNKDLRCFNNAVTCIKKKYKKSTYRRILINKGLISQGRNISDAFSSPGSFEDNSIFCENTSWFFVMDYHPGENWSQRVDVGILDTITNKLTIVKIPNWRSVLDWGKNFSPSYEWVLITRTPPNSFDFNPNDCEFKVSSKEPISFSQDNIVFKNKPPQKLWALIVCAAKEDASTFSSHYNTEDMYSLLRAYDVCPKKIYYLNPNLCKSDKRIFSIEVSQSKIKEALNEISQNKNEKDNKLLIFITGHGTSNGTIVLPNNNSKEEITSNEFNNWLSEIPFENLFIIIGSCYSGKLANTNQSISNRKGNSLQNRIFITTTSASEQSYGDKDNEYDNNPYDRGNEFISGFLEAFTNPCADELDSRDKKISLYEAFCFAEKYCLTCKKNIRNNMCYLFNNTNDYMQPVIVTENAAKKAFLFWD